MSGSLELVKDSLNAVVDQLGKGDQMSIVTYGGLYRVRVQSVQPQRDTTRFDSLYPRRRNIPNQTAITQVEGLTTLAQEPPQLWRKPIMKTLHQPHRRQDTVKTPNAVESAAARPVQRQTLHAARAQAARAYFAAPVQQQARTIPVSEEEKKKRKRRRKRLLMKASKAKARRAGIPPQNTIDEQIDNDFKEHVYETTLSPAEMTWRDLKRHTTDDPDTHTTHPHTTTTHPTSKSDHPRSTTCTPCNPGDVCAWSAGAGQHWTSAAAWAMLAPVHPTGPTNPRGGGDEGVSDSSQPQSQSGTSHIQPTSSSEGLFEHYAPLPNTWDDYFEPTGAPRAPTTTVAHFLDRLGAKAFRERQTLADRTFLRGGITFSVYNDTKGVEKIFPFDLIPRIVTAAEWNIIESGLIQRIEALNAFLLDIYSDQRILHEGVVPRHMVESSQGFLKPMMGVRPPGGNHMFVSGIDLIRGPDGDFMVLEDNVRTPSGVSYVMENRNVMQQVMHDLCSTVALVPVQDYPLHLREALASISPRAPEETQIVVLTPGPYNSAYFEHGFLARSMGCPLVQPQDLFVHDHRVYVKTTRGPQRVDVIYRRVDDDFIDPDVFRPDSLLGV
ncbi:MAG: circularly permuted type 2 ATP-grasp protein, partial [Myxococcota bacterium]